MKQWRPVFYGVMIGLLATGAILFIAQPDHGTPIVLSPAPSPTSTLAPKPTATSTPIYVQISGEVRNPGVYVLQINSRLDDLIELAGGMTQQADEDRVNLVILMRDGDYFYIPTFGEEIPETAHNAPINSNLNREEKFDYPLDLNQASQEALESLPGIGPAKAFDIITYRTEVGSFLSVDDLLNVNGIGPTTLEALRDFLFVEP
jgi:competence protein ComEA